MIYIHKDNLEENYWKLPNFFDLKREDVAKAIDEDEFCKHILKAGSNIFNDKDRKQTVGVKLVSKNRSERQRYLTWI